jgi:hypothetical protein
MRIPVVRMLEHHRRESVADQHAGIVSMRGDVTSLLYGSIIMQASSSRIGEDQLRVPISASAVTLTAPCRSISERTRTIEP